MSPWRGVRATPIETPGEFVAWLDVVGICTWSPVPGLDFPNLAEAMGKSDVMGQTWFWKDDLHVERRLYYGKLLSARPTFVSMGLLPAVIAARGDIDPYTFHEQGRLSAPALRVYEALVRQRRLSTGDLRAAAGLTGKELRPELEKATQALEALFQICKVEITGRTRGTYGYVWGLVEDWVPEVLRDAARLRPETAARMVLDRLVGVGVALSEAQWRRLFGWTDDAVGALRDG